MCARARITHPHARARKCFAVARKNYEPTNAKTYRYLTHKARRLFRKSLSPMAMSEYRICSSQRMHSQRALAVPSRFAVPVRLHVGRTRDIRRTEWKYRVVRYAMTADASKRRRVSRTAVRNHHSSSFSPYSFLFEFTSSNGNTSVNVEILSEPSCTVAVAALAPSASGHNQ